MPASTLGSLPGTLIPLLATEALRGPPSCLAPHQRQEAPPCAGAWAPPARPQACPGQPGLAPPSRPERFPLSSAEWDLPADLPAGVPRQAARPLGFWAPRAGRTLTNGVWTSRREAAGREEGGRALPGPGVRSGGRERGVLTAWTWAGRGWISGHSRTPILTQGAAREEGSRPGIPEAGFLEVGRLGEGATNPPLKFSHLCFSS